MKNIYSISIVKNEVDIIESFVRYNYSFLDGMMIIDHSSSDNTSKILDNLKGEGYNIWYVKWNEVMHQQGEVLTNFIYELIEEKNPDIIIPLDADEFLSLEDKKGNLRSKLESLDLNYIYTIKWKTYLPHNENSSEKFIPKKMKYIRDPSLEEHYKLIISSKLFKDFNLKLNNGSHDCNNLDEKYIKELTSIKMAHYPIRSKKQLISNIIIGTLNTFAMPYRNKLESWHWLELFEKIYNNEELDLVKIAHDYSSRKAENEEVNLILDPLNTDFCENSTIKYDKLANIDIDKNLINYSIDLAKQFSKLKEKNIELNKEIKRKNKRIAELQSTKKWFEYKTSNILTRTKNKFNK